MQQQTPQVIQEILQRHPTIWRGSEDINRHRLAGVSTGYPELNELLPGNGWPQRALTEIITPRWGVGELQLLMPVMKAMTQQKRWVIWVSPPHIPYAPAMAQAGIDINYVIVIQPNSSCNDALWSIEKALQSQACSMVLAWSNWLPNGVLRRLQLAAEAGGSLGILFRQHETKHSPAALRLRLHSSFQGLRVQIIKARGTTSTRSRNVNLCLH